MVVLLSMLCSIYVLVCWACVRVCVCVRIGFT